MICYIYFILLKKEEYLARVIFSMLIQTQLFLGRKSGGKVGGRYLFNQQLEYKLLEGTELGSQFLVSPPRSLKERCNCQKTVLQYNRAVTSFVHPRLWTQGSSCKAEGIWRMFPTKQHCSPWPAGPLRWRVTSLGSHFIFVTPCFLE